jgi:hypothetical protein
MQDINFVKAKATAAAEFLAGHGFDVKHTVILEMMSRLEGFRNWSTYREKLTVSPAVSTPPTVQQALTMCYRWMSSAPIDELEAVEAALGENAPLAMAAEALKASGTGVTEATPAPQTEAKWSPLQGAMTDALYLKRGGNCCPSCGGGNISGGRMEVDGSSSSQKITCEDCGAEWADMYGLKGYDVLEGGLDTEAIESVVDDIKQRAKEYGFSIDSEGKAKECIEESCELLDIVLSSFETTIAVRQLME